MSLSTGRVVLSVILSALMLMASAPVFAQTAPPLDGGGDNKGFHRERAYFSPEPFEHFDTMSGNIVLTFTDLVLPGNAGRDLRFLRTYNNQNGGGGSFGENSRWSFGLDGMVMRVVERPVTPNLLQSSLLENWVATTPSLIKADGSWLPTIYIGNPNAPGAVPEHMEVVSAGFYKYDRQNRVLRMPDGTVSQYNESGRLTSVLDAHNNLVELEWSATQLVVRQHLSMAQVRVITLALDGADRVTGMEYEGRHWTYTYDYEFGLRKDITHVTLPEGLEWQFTYDNAPRLGVNMYEFDGLASIITPNQGLIQYHYIEREVCEATTNPSCETRRYLGSRDSSGLRGTASGTWQIILDANGGLYGSYMSGDTQIVTPSQQLIEYYHQLTSSIPGNVLSGAIAVRTTVVRPVSGGPAIETEDVDYTDLPLVTGGFATIPTLQRVTVNRHGRQYRVERTFRTTNFADYHQPETVVETGDGPTRTTTYTYRHLLTPTYAVALPESESIQVSGDTQTFSRSWLYDSFGSLTRTRTYGLDTVYAQDPSGNGNIAYTYSPSGQTTYFDEYSWGVPKVIRTAAWTITREINLDGTVASETKGSRITTYEYDLLMRPTVVYPPGGTNTTETTYDNVNGTVTTRRGSSFLTTTLDGFGRPVATINSRLVQTATSYYPEGWVKYSSRPFLGTADVGTRIEYDLLGRVSKEIVHDREHNADGVYRGYTYGPGTVTIRDENGRTSLQTWQAVGHPDKKRLTALQDAKQQNWTYAYNALGSLKRVTAPDSLARTWEYNDQSLLFRETHPESGVTTYAYTSGLMTKKTDANGQSFVYGYDGNDRLSSIRVGNELTIFTYENGSDNRKTMNVNGVHTEFDYDVAGRRTSRVDTVDGLKFRTTFGYDNDDNLTSISYPSHQASGDRRRIGYDYDSEHRISRVYDLQVPQRDFAKNFAYHPSGAVTAYTSGNEVPNTFTYDPNRYWITSLTVGSHWSLQYLNYDGVGNVGGLIDSRAGMDQQFAYDALDRLVQVVAGPGYPPAQWAYDAHGNRTNANGSTYTYYPGKLRLWTQNSATYTYDNNGNLKTTTTPSRTFAYNAWNRVASVTVGSTTTNYRYDADDWRVKKTTGTTTTYFLRGLNGELLTEWTNPGTSGTIRDYLYAGSRLVSAITRPWNEPSDSITPGGPSVTVTVGTPGVPVWLTVNATLNQRVSFRGSNGTIANQAVGCDVWVTLYKPDNTPIPVPSTCMEVSGFMDVKVLSEPGTYKLKVTPTGNATGNLTLTAYDVPPDATGTLTFGTPFPVQILTPGQNGSLTFEGTQNQRISMLATTGITGSIEAGCDVWTGIRDPNNVLVPGTSTCVESGAFMEVKTLPATGIYTLGIDPTTTATGASILAVYSIPPDAYGSLTINAQPRLVEIWTPGQVAELTFNGTSGQQVTVRLTDHTIGHTTVRLVRPDGSIQTSLTHVAQDFNLQPQMLTSPGIYKVVIDPTGERIGDIKVQVTIP